MDRNLDDVTKQQRGFFSTAQATAAGLSEYQRRRRLRSGAWVETADGVQRLAGIPTTWRGALQAALLDAGDRSLITHGAAARLEGFPTYNVPSVDVLVPYGLDHECRIATVHE